MGMPAVCAPEKSRQPGCQGTYLDGRRGPVWMSARFPSAGHRAIVLALLSAFVAAPLNLTKGHLARVEQLFLPCLVVLA